jgi:hypothetical protein
LRDGSEEQASKESHGGDYNPRIVTNRQIGLFVLP